MGQADRIAYLLDERDQMVEVIDKLAARFQPDGVPALGLGVGDGQKIPNRPD